MAASSKRPASSRPLRPGPRPIRLRWDRIGALTAILAFLLLFTIRNATADPGKAAPHAAVKRPPVSRAASADTSAMACEPAGTGRIIHHAGVAPGQARPARTVALTFDDGPGEWTPEILSVLRQQRVPATFFVIGTQAQARPKTVQAIAAQGHLIGNHSWTHTIPSTTTGWQTSDLSREVDDTNALLARITGRRPCLFRPPGGVVKGAQKFVASREMDVALWSVDTQDWRDQKRGANTTEPAVRAIVASAESGLSQEHPVLLLHDGGGYRGATFAALPAIISSFRNHGYTFVRLNGT